MKNREYYIEVSLTGRIKCFVDAKDKHEAINKIFDSLEGLNIEVSEKNKSDISIEEIEWDLIDEAQKGNISEVHVRDMYIEESK